MPNNFSKAVLLAVLAATFPAMAAEKPPIMARSAWHAKAPSLPMTPQKPVAILVHHTGSIMKPKTSLAAKMKGLQRFSQTREKLGDGRTKPAWPDVPYHFYIAADGSTAEGRTIDAVGDTNTGYNPTGFIQVVVEGNFDTEQPTPAQLAALNRLLAWLRETYKISSSNILSHNDKAQTACPGKHLKVKLAEILVQKK